MLHARQSRIRCKLQKKCRRANTGLVCHPVHEGVTSPCDPLVSSPIFFTRRLQPNFKTLSFDRRFSNFFRITPRLEWLSWITREYHPWTPVDHQVTPHSHIRLSLVSTVTLIHHTWRSRFGSVTPQDGTVAPQTPTR